MFIRFARAFLGFFSCFKVDVFFQFYHLEFISLVIRLFFLRSHLCPEPYFKIKNKTHLRHRITNIFKFHHLLFFLSFIFDSHYFYFYLFCLESVFRFFFLQFHPPLFFSIKFDPSLFLLLSFLLLQVLKIDIFFTISSFKIY
jgi:hypothetical protein